MRIDRNGIVNWLRIKSCKYIYWLQMRDDEWQLVGESRKRLVARMGKG